MTKELEVVSEMKFDKQDVVTVALAKIEAKIRKHVRDAKAESTALREEIKKSEKKFPKFLEGLIPGPMKAKKTSLNKALSSAKLGKSAKWEIIASAHSYREENSFELAISKLDENGKVEQDLILFRQTGKYSKDQKDLLKKIEDLEAKEREAVNRGVEWKSKLNDMAAAERQMRAVVVESELNKTKSGQALVKLLTDNYEDTIKKISM